MTSSPVPHTLLTLGDLSQVLSAFDPELHGDGSVRLAGVQQDSRRVSPGDLFIARSGQHSDGHAFVKAAIENGAVAVLADPSTTTLEPLSVPVLCVRDARRAMAFAAEAVLGAPSKQLKLVGVTGTNGKTTTVTLVERALEEVGVTPARLGTTGFSFRGELRESNLTTPEADEVSRLMSEVVTKGGTHFIMEASSHALDLGRVDALSFHCAAFSNLTQDHLDHHGDMATYEAAKRRLFTDLAPAVAVINVTDAAGQRFAQATQATRLIRVGNSPDCEVQPCDIQMDEQGIRGTVRVGSRNIEVSTRLVGAHNLENLALAMGILEALDVDVQRAVSGLSGAFGVPGRLERCDTPDDDIIVLVDYAHTPDALERALKAVRQITRGRLHCIFGCGGDRDPKKRPLMGYAVGKQADFAIVTNDNPRTEDPETIASAIEPGLVLSGGQYRVELDRSLAIQQVVVAASPGDTVLIAGKGHEPYQIFGTTKTAFDDRIEARGALALRRQLSTPSGGSSD